MPLVSLWSQRLLGCLCALDSGHALLDKHGTTGQRLSAPPTFASSSSPLITPPLYQRRHEFVGELVAAVAREHAEGHSARSSLEAVQRELRDRHARHLAAVRRYEVALAQAQVSVYIQTATDVVTDHRAALV